MILSQIHNSIFMAESLNQQSSASGRLGFSRLLRYPLRSASKQNEKLPVVASDSAIRRGISASNASKSVSVLDPSVKEKSAKPLRRLSNPSNISVLDPSGKEKSAKPLRRLSNPSNISALDPSVKEKSAKPLRRLSNPSNISVLDPSGKEKSAKPLRRLSNPSNISALDPSVKEKSAKPLRRLSNPSNISVLDPSGKEKSAKPLRRLSNPSNISVLDPSVKEKSAKPLRRLSNPSIISVLDPSVKEKSAKPLRRLSNPSSISALDPSVKEKSAKPLRRLSNPSNINSSPASRLSGSITPVSEARSKGLSGIQGKIGTPVSDVSKSSSKKRFNLLSSSSYWLAHIKLSETAAKHSVSLGFFKLALEAGCDPLQRVRDELKSYARKHNLTEFGESVKILFDNYNITENFEQLLISETCSHVPEEGTQSSDEYVYVASPVEDKEQAKRISLAGNDSETMQVNQPKKENSQEDDSVSKDTPKIN